MEKIGMKRNEEKRLQVIKRFQKNQDIKVQSNEERI